MKTRALLLAAVLLGGAASASAAEPEFYLGASLGRSDTEYANASGGDVTRVYGGVRFPGNWGIELAAYDLGDIRLQDQGRFDLALEGVSVMGVFNLRPAGYSGFGLFFKGGLHNTESTLSSAELPRIEEDDTTSLAFGFGADYAFGRNFGVRAEVELLTGVEDFSESGDSTVSHFSLGAELRF